MPKKKEKTIKEMLTDTEVRLPKQDSATGRGLKTGVQTFIGTTIALVATVGAAANGVPGCSDAIINSIKDNLLLISGGSGVSSAAVAFIWNLLRSDVKNY